MCRAATWTSRSAFVRHYKMDTIAEADHPLSERCCSSWCRQACVCGWHLGPSHWRHGFVTSQCTKMSPLSQMKMEHWTHCEDSFCLRMRRISWTHQSFLDFFAFSGGKTICKQKNLFVQLLLFVPFCFL